MISTLTTPPLAKLSFRRKSSWFSNVKVIATKFDDLMFRYEIEGVGVIMHSFFPSIVNDEDAKSKSFYSSEIQDIRISLNSKEVIGIILLFDHEPAIEAGLLTLSSLVFFE